MNQLSEMDLQYLKPHAGNHSIEQVILALEWSVPLSLEQLESIRKNARPPEGTYPREEPQISFNMNVDIFNGVPRPSQSQELSGYVYSRFSTSGQIEKQIQISGKSCLFIASDYLSWEAFQDEVNSIFGPILAQLPGGCGVDAIGLQYTDKFKWTGERADWTLSSIIKSGSRYAAEYVRECDDYCHSHLGYFENNSVSHNSGEKVEFRQLDNVNIDVVEQDGFITLVLLSSHKGIFGNPICTNKEGFAKAVQSELRMSHKNVLSSLLEKPVLDLIGFQQLNSEVKV